MPYRLIKWISYSLCAGTLLIGLIGLIICFQITPSIPQLPERLNDIFSNPTEIYASDAQGDAVLAHTLGGHQRIPLSEMAPVFRDAIIATEDEDFYSHRGLDIIGIIRAFLINLKTGRLDQGGSTITQQLTRRLFFSLEKQWIRKIREQLAAMQIEFRYSKEEILEAYCNNMYYGASAYGVEDASQRFFSKHARDLTLGEASLLAGLLQSPSSYNPYYHMDRALKRREFVLQQMLDNHYITEEQARMAREAEIVLKGTSIGPGRGPYFLDYVESVMVERYGDNLVYNGGLKVYTTMDLEMQSIAEDAVRSRLAMLDSLVRDPIYSEATKDEKAKALEAALVAIDTQTGAVKALVGGRDYTRSEYNRAVQSIRHPGSGFKPIVYLAALEQLGYSPITVVVDEPVSYTTDIGEVWEPQNFTRKYEGAVVLKWALLRSINVISAKMINAMGPQTVVDYARRLGITSRLDPVPSLALGTYGVSPLEMAGAYSVFATEGIYRRPHVIARVEDANGRVLEENRTEGERVISPQSAFLMVDMLRGVVQRGTAADIPSKYGFITPAGGKTGTSSDSKDVWFNGFTRRLATSVWVGYDDARPLKPIMGREATGGAGAIPIWVDFMKRATETLVTRSRTSSNRFTQGEARTILYEDFPVPLGIEFREVDIHTGKAPAGSDSVITAAVPGATPKLQPD